jgi:hypothetical protein
MDVQLTLYHAVRQELQHDFLLEPYKKVYEKKTILETVKKMVTNEYESQKNRYDALIKSALTNGNVELNNILDTPPDKQEQYEKFIYYMTLYKLIQIQSNIFLEHRRIALAIENKMVELDMQISDLNKLNSNKTALESSITISSRKPKYFIWGVAIVVSTGLIIQAAYVIDKKYFSFFLH